MPLTLRYCILILLIFTAACSHPAKPLFEELPATQTGILFNNTPTSKDSLNILDYLYYYNGGGVAVGDIDNDGLPDICFTANTKGGNKLYLNKGGFHFEDITAQAGVQGDADWSTGVTMADVNGDGLLDIYVCAISGKLGLKGHNMLFINQGDHKFSEQSNAYGLDFAGYSTQAVFFDYDRDGDLDCYLLNQSSHSVETYGDTTLRRIPDQLAGDKFYRNDNTNHFTDVTARSGIYTSALGYGLGIAVADINNDGWDDIYIGNDFHENDYYYVNNHNGTFTESGARHFNHYSRFSMGNDIADYNNDGQPDIITADMLPPDEKVLKTYSSGEQADTYKYTILDHGYQPQYSRNCLHVNLGEGKAFSEQALMAGIAATDWSWSPLFADFDNDGIKDLFISNGIVRRPVDLDYMRFISTSLVSRQLSTSNRLDSVALAQMPEGRTHSYCYQGNSNGLFSDLSTAWGMTGQHCSNGAAYADLDNDGNLDLIVNRLYENAAIYRNTGTNKRSLTISLKGQKPNSFGIGTKVYLLQKGKLQYQQLMLTRGFQSSTEPRLHFGLDTTSNVDSLLVVWPNQRYQLLTKLKTNQSITLNQANAKDSFQYNLFFPKALPLFTDITDSVRLNWRHHEDGFYDYARQYFIPHQLSTRGPKIAVADINKDGLDDIFVCGAKGQGGSLFIQQPNGEWICSDTTLFSADKGDDQVDAIFVDVNGDGAPDLYVAHGGNDDIPEQPGLLDRLYFNDGNGRFTYANNALPLIPGNKSTVTAADIDHDGDQDLFVGICADPDAYGIAQDAYLLLNDGKGKFNVAPATTAPFSALGMVTAAGFADLNGDGWPDLVAVGEWMQPKIFLNENGHFKQTQQDLPPGLWQSLMLTDLDGDGHIDLIAGNYGLNSKLHASKDQPLKLYVKDFTGSHTLQQVLTYTTPEGEFTFLGKDELEKKLPWIKKTFLSYTDFAGKTVREVFGDALNDLKPLEVTSLATTWFKNDGKANLKAHPLPEAAQLSPTFALAQIGNYLLIGGNFNSVLPYEGRYDANWGTVLKLEKNALQPISPVTSGFLSRGDIRDIKKIRTPKGPCYIVARNNDKPLFFINK